MAINLTKGQRIDVGLQNAGIGLGWNPNAQASSEPYDLDASAFLLGENGKLVSGEFFGSGTVGSGCGLEQMRFLSPGDMVELEVEGIGVLRNRIVKG